MELSQLQEDFSCMVLKAQPRTLTQFILWLDLKVSEFKVNGYMLLDKTDQILPRWIEEELSSLLGKSVLEQSATRRTVSSHKRTSPCIGQAPVQGGGHSPVESRAFLRKKKQRKLIDYSSQHSTVSNCATENGRYRTFKDTSSGEVITVDMSDEGSDETVSNASVPVSNHMTVNNQSVFEPVNYVNHKVQQRATHSKVIRNPHRSSQAVSRKEKFGIRSDHNLGHSSERPETLEHMSDQNDSIKPLFLVEHSNSSGSHINGIDSADKTGVHSRDWMAKDKYLSVRTRTVNEGFRESEEQYMFLQKEEMDVKPDIAALQKSSMGKMSSPETDDYQHLTGSEEQVRSLQNGESPTTDVFPGSVSEVLEVHRQRINDSVLLPYIDDPFVMNALETGNAAAIWHKMVGICASHLLKHCSGQPSSLNYQAFGEALYQKYPCIRADKGSYPWSAFMKAVSQKIRHTRHKMRRGINIRDFEMMNSFFEGERRRILERTGSLDGSDSLFGNTDKGLTVYPMSDNSNGGEQSEIQQTSSPDKCDEDISEA